MSHYKDPYEPPLAPKVRVLRPPWAPSYRDYNGRPEWWAELGFKDMQLRSGINLGVYAGYKEEDINYWDEKVPDGTSVIGLFGLDTTYYKNYAKKADIPVDLSEYQRKIMENSTQYKNIVKKWNISKEHPGIPVNPTLDTIQKTDLNQLGVQYFFPRVTIPYHYGPRFWDTPINKNCLEKGLALVKYTAAGTFAWFFIDNISHPKYARYPMTSYPGIFLKSWVTTILPLPAAMAMTFGVASCTAASIRHKDDTWNWTIGWLLCFARLITVCNNFGILASIMAAATHTTIRNNTIQGIIIASVGIVLGAIYQHLRKTPQGLQGLARNATFSGECAPFTSPLTWKHITIGDLSESQIGVHTPAAHRFIL